jgi:ankyrin repeat protein
MFNNIHYNDYTGSYFSNRFDGKDTILHILVRNNNIERLDDLLKHYRLDIECKNWKGQTPFELAVDLRNVTAASMLCRYKYDHIINKLQSELSKERALREEYQKTIDTTGKHFNLMSKLESTQQPQKVVYLDTPLSTFNQYTLYIGYFMEFSMLIYIMTKIFA